jgi:hypothetical protein
MIRALLALAPAGVLLAACGSDPPPAPPEAPPIASAAELAGEYRVAAVDASQIDLPHGVTASIDGARIEVASDCIKMAWSYRLADGVLATEQAPAQSCRRAYLPTELALLAALDVADAAHRTPANAVELSGSGHSVTLFLQ